MKKLLFLLTIKVAMLVCFPVNFAFGQFVSQGYTPGTSSGVEDSTRLLLDNDTISIFGYYQDGVLTRRDSLKKQRPTYAYITPEMFGAAGDGTRDDRAAVQAAIDSAAVSTTKRVILAGKYRIEPGGQFPSFARLNVPDESYSYITIDGLGYGELYFPAMAQATNTGLWFGNIDILQKETGTIRGITLKNLNFKSDGPETNAGNAVSFNSLDRDGTYKDLLIENLKFDSIDASSLLLYYVETAKVRDIYTENCGFHSVAVENRANVQYDSSVVISIENVVCDGNYGGLCINYTSESNLQGDYPSFITTDGMTFVNSKGQGSMKISGNWSGVFENATLKNCSALEQSALRYSFGPATDWVIKNVTIDSIDGGVINFQADEGMKSLTIKDVAATNYDLDGDGGQAFIVTGVDRLYAENIDITRPFESVGTGNQFVLGAPDSAIYSLNDVYINNTHGTNLISGGVGSKILFDDVHIEDPVGVHAIVANIDGDFVINNSTFESNRGGAGRAIATGFSSNIAPDFYIDNTTFIGYSDAIRDYSSSGKRLIISNSNFLGGGNSSRGYSIDDVISVGDRYIFFDGTEWRDASSYPTSLTDGTPLKGPDVYEAGTFTATPDASGNIQIPHGLGQIPSTVTLTVTGNNTYLLNWLQSSTTATDIFVLVSDNAGAPVTSGSVTISWTAFI